MKKTPIRRNWSYAESKRELKCRACELTFTELRKLGRTIELAHITGREFDLTPAIGYEEIPLVRSNLLVAPTRVISLCGPSVDSGTCHQLQHAHKLDLIPHLTREEEVQATADLGLHRAYTNLGGGLPPAEGSPHESR